MEYHCNKDGGLGVASRIFEKGLESFGDEIEFVLRYLGFLISVNDDNSEAASILLGPQGLLTNSIQTHGRFLSVSFPHSMPSARGLCGKDGHVMSTNLVIWRLHRNLRSGFLRSTPLVREAPGYWVHHALIIFL